MIFQYKNDIEITNDQVIFKGDILVISMSGNMSNCGENITTPEEPLGFYKNHVEAAANGVPLFGEYIAADQNDLGVPYGTHVTRVE